MNDSGLLYIALMSYILYSLQGIVYTSGSILSQLLLFVCLLIGVYCWVRSLAVYSKTTLFVSFFIVLNVIGYILYDGLYESLAFGHLKGILSCFLPFFIGFHYTSENKIDDNVFRYLFYILLIISVLNFYRLEAMLFLDSNSENVVNNISYSFVRLIPLMFFLPNKNLLRMLSVLLVSLFIIAGTKRGAIVTGFIGIVMYLLYLIKEDKSGKKGLKNFIIFGFVIFLVIFLIHNVENNEFLLSRFNSVRLSGREEIYPMIFNYWYFTDNIFNLLFGFGFIASMDITRSFLAHNDWLEVLSNFGILGVFVYGALICSMYLSIKNIPYKRELYASRTIILLWMATTIFSTWYNSIDVFPPMFLMGHLVAFASYNHQVVKK